MQIAVAKPTLVREVDRPISRIGSSLTLLAFLAVVLPVLAGLYQIRPPRVVGPDAPLTEFSAVRAVLQLKPIAQAPHPVGSIEHEKVFERIVSELSAMGGQPEVQETVAVTDKNVFPIVAARVKNIVARLQGSDSKKAVLLTAHYDSVATGPGASDDGAAVAALLETFRALKAGPPLRNDVILLFTDSEEIGLIGARAFVNESPLIKDVGVVLNFEARGNAGPSMMFETSDQNGGLISQFARSAPYPFATSLSYEVYKRLPNDTDLTVFREAGLAGLNFAFIEGLNSYHTRLDDLTSIDECSLQHHGSYCLALARAFGNSDFSETGRGNAVYFIMFPPLVHYPVTYAIAFAAVALLMFAAVLFIGIRTARVRLPGLVMGFLALLGGMTASAIAVALVWWIVNKTPLRYSRISQGDAYNSWIFFLSFVFLSIAITSAVYSRLWTRFSIESLSMGALTWWLILTVISSIYLPGASYVLLWPRLFSLFGIGSSMMMQRTGSGPKTDLVILSVSAIPAALIVVPLVCMVLFAMTLSAAPVMIVMVISLFGVLLPQFRLMMGSRMRLLLPYASLVIACALLIVGAASSGLDSSHRQVNNIFYPMNVDKGKAVWASFDQSPDEWTSQFFANNIGVGSLADQMGSGYSGFMRGQASAAAITAPVIKLLSDSSVDGIRKMRLHIESSRNAPLVTIYGDTKAHVAAYSIGEKRMENKNKQDWALRYYAIPKDGFDLTLEIKGAGPVTLMATDQSYGLPENLASLMRPRPDYMMAADLPYSDSTLVTASFTF